MMDVGSVIGSVVGGLNPLSALTALIPLITHAGNAAINRWIAPAEFKPASVDEYIAMREADLKLFTAINGADGNQESYKWVAAVKQTQRPVIAWVVVCTWSLSHLWSFNTDAINNFAAAIGFYLFADRTLFYAASKINTGGAK